MLFRSHEPSVAGRNVVTLLPHTCTEGLIRKNTTDSAGRSVCAGDAVPTELSPGCEELL